MLSNCQGRRDAGGIWNANAKWTVYWMEHGCQVRAEYVTGLLGGTKVKINKNKPITKHEPSYYEHNSTSILMQLVQFEWLSRCCH